MPTLDWLNRTAAKRIRSAWHGMAGRGFICLPCSSFDGGQGITVHLLMLESQQAVIRIR